MPFSNPSGVINVEADNGSFGTVQAQSSLLYQGTEMSELLDRLPKGIVAQGLLAAGNYTATSEKELLEVGFQAVGGREYRIWMENMRGTSSLANDNFKFALHYTDDGSQPIISSTKIEEAERNIPNAGRYSSNNFCVIVYAPQTRFIRLLLTFFSVFGGTVTVQFDDINVVVEDVGRVVQNTGINRYPATPVPTKTLYTFDIQPYSSRSYQGNGNLLSAGNGDQYLYQGDIGVDGNRRSWFWFNTTDVAKIAAASGVPLSDVNYCRIFLFYQHWYYSSGGLASIGYHSGNNPGNNTEPTGGVQNVLRAGWPGRNVGQWVDLMGNANIMNAIRTAYLKGFMLGNTGSGSLNDYGIALGASAALGQKPGFQMSYYK